MFALGTLSSVTVLLIALIVAISLYAFQNERLMRDWMFAPYAVKRGHKYYSLISSGFIHADFQHLGFNMLTMYFFGMDLENVYEMVFGYNGFWVAALFLTGVLVGNLATFWQERDNSNYRALGASGGVESVVFATILIMPTGDICMFGALCLPAWLFGFGYLGYSYYSSRTANDGIGHTAHLAGAIWGVAWQTLLTPWVWRDIYEMLRVF